MKKKKLTKMQYLTRGLHRIVSLFLLPKNKTLIIVIAIFICEAF